MRQQDQISKRKEAEIERNRAIARKRIEILNELKSAGLHAEDAPLICVLPKKRHPKKTRSIRPQMFPKPRRSKYHLRQERKQRWGVKAMKNPFLLDVINAS